MVHHLGAEFTMAQLQRMVRDISLATLQHAAIGRAGLRVYDGGRILIQNGGLDITGTANITGRLDGSGTFDWTGPMWLRGSIMIPGNLTGVGDLLWSGPWEMRGDGDITGDVDLSGDLIVTPTGLVKVGNLTIDRGGAWDGRITAPSTLLLQAPVVAMTGQGSAQNFHVFNNLTVEGSGTFWDVDALGTVSANIKNFKIPHPVTDGRVLRHGATESPVSGVEYWGEETLDDTGELTVLLPHYFEALTKPDNRAVLVTARGFLVDWGDIVDGKFTVTGKPGGRFSWLVKAERAGADFPAEAAE